MTEWQLNAIRIYLWHRVMLTCIGRGGARGWGGGDMGGNSPPPRGAASVYIGETGCSGNMGKLLQLHFLKLHHNGSSELCRIKADVK